MQKTTTPLKKTDLAIAKNSKNSELGPKESTIQNIMKFASSYRVQRINENQFVEMFLN